MFSTTAAFIVLHYKSIKISSSFKAAAGFPGNTGRLLFRDTLFAVLKYGTVQSERQKLGHKLCLWRLLPNPAHCYLCSKLKDILTCKSLSASNMLCQLKRPYTHSVMKYAAYFQVSNISSLVNKCSVPDYTNKQTESHPTLAVTKITSPSPCLLVLYLQFPNQLNLQSSSSAQSDFYLSIKAIGVLQGIFFLALDVTSHQVLRRSIQS